jgi:hypothetical protein
MTTLTADTVHSGHVELIQQYPFESFITLTYRKPPSSPDAMKQQLKDYVRRLSVKTGLRLGIVGAIIIHKRNHIHLLVLGRNRRGETMNDILPACIESLWPHGNVVVASVHDIAGIANYISGAKNLGTQGAFVETYGHKLLNRTRMLSRAC